MLLTKVYTGVCLLLAAVYLKECDALVEPLESLPHDLQQYLDISHSTGDLTHQSARLVFWTSVNMYTSKFINSRPDLTPQQATYLKNALDDAFAPFNQNVSEAHGGRRAKRQISQFRVRREVRAMSDNERNRYFAALNAMKVDRQLPPNVYDFLAAFHSGDNIARAHFGPAFPSHHRLYLLIFEHFLRLQDPAVTIPYWASVLDNEMQDPTQSVIWGPAFFGNGNGAIRTGPFQNWRQINPQTSFTRNVQGGQLVSYAGVDRIVRRTRNFEILVPTALPDSNLETQHAAPHVFVGGSMNNLNFAARDPIFFSHHSFIDEIWERFRENQIRNSINPQTDYFFDEFDPRFRPQHRPTANAGFTGIGTITGWAGLGEVRTWTQELGYLNIISEVINYEPVPECPLCANSPYLFCNTNLGRCVSRTIAETSAQGLRVRRQAPRTFQEKAREDVCQRQSFINDVDTRWFQKSNLLPGLTANKWAYIPVKVVSKRPPEYGDFGKYCLYTQGTQRSFKDELLKQGLQKRYDSCEKYQGPVGKITIVAHGLNHEGYSEEYVLVDNRLGVSEASGFLPIHMPTGSYPSEVIIAAFDSCGRACKPYSKKGSTGSMVTDPYFTGGMKVSVFQPKQFSDTYAEAQLNIWDVPTKSSCPTLNYDNMPVSFFCEQADPWIWESAPPGPGPDMTQRQQGAHVWSEGPDMTQRQQGAHVWSEMGTAQKFDSVTFSKGSGRTSNSGNGNIPAKRGSVVFRGSSELTYPLYIYTSDTDA